jgi:GNAT superfamily N-acetyltransferase
MSVPLEIREARDRRSRKAFLNVPFDLYRDDPYWVPPLRQAHAKLFAGKAAFFDHAEMALLLAERGGRAVGRIAAIHNTAHNAHYDDRVGFFGFFECSPDDPEAAAALLDAAEAWLSQRGLDTIRGPVNPSMNAECGLLIEGFDMMPMVMMPYNPRAYVDFVETAGFGKCKDLYAYLIHHKDMLPGSEKHERLVRIVSVLRRRHPEVHLHCLDMKKYQQEILRFLAVFEEARGQNWGYVPLTEEEILETAAEMKMVVDPEVIIFAEVDDEPAGALIAIPNISGPLKSINGRLFPFGFLKFLREIKRLDTIRVLGIAALEKHRAKGITALLLMEVILRSIEAGYHTAEASWVLEDNDMSNRTISKALNPTRYKTYRIYEKSVGA